MLVLPKTHVANVAELTEKSHLTALAKIISVVTKAYTMLIASTMWYTFFFDHLPIKQTNCESNQLPNTRTVLFLLVGWIIDAASRTSWEFIRDKRPAPMHMHVHFVGPLLPISTYRGASFALDLGWWV